MGEAYFLRAPVVPALGARDRFFSTPSLAEALWLVVPLAVRSIGVPISIAGGRSFSTLRRLAVAFCSAPALSPRDFVVAVFRAPRESS